MAIRFQLVLEAGLGTCYDSREATSCPQKAKQRMAKSRQSHQQKIISRYYENRDQIDLQRLSELVTNLYLADSPKKVERQWTTAGEIMERLKVPKTRIEHVLKQRDAAILAEVVKDLQSGKIS